ncbi:methionyl-tRNA formyltransferase [Rhodothalassium salexigens]|uniref:methionyl-tRNA formyltransferase n=1 Tax=Rhodothalassium salexigens TaxID=1086 RepID=UPI00191435D0|nr:methionyl-tRNA formyltransferase [Rhodothalassium salexigens]MBK5909966.1 methionyl-tRNA formyltransferase [Rhodothalassium salexigens]
MSNLRVAFMGTPGFAVPSLTALHDAGYRVVQVYTQPPRPAGRGKKLQKSAVHKEAERLGVPVRTPGSLKDPDEQAAFKALDLDVAVVAAYGQILPKAILDAPRLGCVNVHASLLPRWRGAAPIHRAILEGDAETGVSIMVMDKGLDTGPVLAEQRTAIGGEDTNADVHDRLAYMGADLLVPSLRAYAMGALQPLPQPADGVTYAAKIDKAEAWIDWSAPAERVDRQVRALNPQPGAWTETPAGRLKVLMGVPEASGESGAVPGTVLDEQLRVACGTGVLRVTVAQRAGRAPMDAETLLRGFALPPGTVLGQTEPAA